MNLPERILKGGHLSEMADYAGRKMLAAWEGAMTDPHDPQLVQDLADAVALLRDVLAFDPPEDWNPRPYIKAQVWIFAKTMPQHPHEYVVIRASTNWREHLRFLAWIRLWGEDELYKGVHYLYRTIDGWRYWAMHLDHTIINRRKEP